MKKHECSEDMAYTIEEVKGSWFMVDKSGGNYYAITIRYCPYCGVKLS